MAVHAQFGGLVLPPPYYAAAEEQQMMRAALKDYGALLSAAAAAAAMPGGDGAYAWQQQYDDYCAGHSELTCNNGGMAVMPSPVPSRKRGREEDDEILHYAHVLLPPGTRRPRADDSFATALASTSGRCAEAVPAPAEHDAVLASELVWRQLHYGAAAEMEMDALVRAECDRLRAGLEVARQRQRRAAAVSSSYLARRAREAEAQLDAARRRAADLEERVRLAAAEAQAWCGVARGNEAVAAGLRATLHALLLRSVEGFGESSSSSAEPVIDDAQSCCCSVPDDRAPAAGDDASAAASSSTAAKWACRACGEGEATVLVLPCRHLCLCKACEPRMGACPVCSGDKNGSLHIALN